MGGQQACCKSRDDANNNLTVHDNLAAEDPVLDNFVEESCPDEMIVLTGMTEEQKRELAEQRAKEKIDKDIKRAEDMQKKREARHESQAKAKEEKARKEATKEVRESLNRYVGEWSEVEAVIKGVSRSEVRVSSFVGELHVDPADELKGLFTWAPRFDKPAPVEVIVLDNGAIQIDSEEGPIVASLVGYSEPFGEALFQTVRLNSGKVLERRGPCLGEYEGQWTKDGVVVADILEGVLTWAKGAGAECGSKSKPLVLDQKEGGAIVLTFGDDAHWLFRGQKRWGVLEKEKVLRWSNGETWMQTSWPDAPTQPVLQCSRGHKLVKAAHDAKWICSSCGSKSIVKEREVAGRPRKEKDKALLRHWCGQCNYNLCSTCFKDTQQGARSRSPSPEKSNGATAPPKAIETPEQPSPQKPKKLDMNSAVDDPAPANGIKNLAPSPVDQPIQAA